MTIAFFDLDKTIFSENSAKLWLKAQWRNNRIRPWQMLNASYWLTKYHLGFTKMDDVIKKSLALFKGEKESSILKETEAFFWSDLCHLYRPGALKAIDEERRRNASICLLTSSYSGLAQLVKHDLQLDFCLATNLEVDHNGFLTGNTIGLPCFGSHKIYYAEGLCSALKTSLNQCSFYTDSASDMPLLNIIGRAIAVNPDPHLRAQARLRNWQIVDWGKAHAK